MAKHSLRIHFDDESGTIAVTHVAVTTLNGHDISVAEPVELADPGAAAELFRALVNTNREHMDARAAEGAVTHVAVLLNQKKKGRTIIKLGGTLKPTSNIAIEKK